MNSLTKKLDEFCWDQTGRDQFIRYPYNLLLFIWIFLSNKDEATVAIWSWHSFANHKLSSQSCVGIWYMILHNYATMYYWRMLYLKHSGRCFFLKKEMALSGQNSDIMFEMLFPKYFISIDFIVLMRGPSKLVISPFFFLHWYLYKRGRQCWTYMYIIFILSMQ